MKTLLSAPNGAFLAIPDGAFPLKEVLAAPTTKQILAALRADPRAQDRKLKIFLSFYQTFDMMGQLQDQGIDLETVDVEEVANAAALLIEQAFEIIIQTFSDEDRALLESLFKEGGVSHV